MVSAFPTNREPAGDGAQMVAQVIKEIIDERILVQRSDVIYATVVDPNTIELDIDGFPLYKDQGDFYVLNGATLIAGARVVAVPIVGVRGKVIVLGEWIARPAPVTSSIDLGPTLTPSGGVLTVTNAIHHVTGGSFSSISAQSHGSLLTLIFDSIASVTASATLSFKGGAGGIASISAGTVLQFIQTDALGHWTETGR